MTRATLLHVLDCPTDLGPAEVRELEQLAQAFPYCQTAHLLLAKAAHDQGTMLASQRLRRAATYAADRTLLRRLIEQVAPAPVLAATADVAVTSISLAPAVEEAAIAYYNTETPAPLVAAAPVAQPPAAAAILTLAPAPELAPKAQPLPPTAAVPPLAPVPEPQSQLPPAVVVTPDAPVAPVASEPQSPPAQETPPIAPIEPIAIASPAIAPPVVLPAAPKLEAAAEAAAIPEPEAATAASAAVEALPEPDAAAAITPEPDSSEQTLVTESIAISTAGNTPVEAMIPTAETAPVEAEAPPLLIDRENVVIESTVAAAPEASAADVAPETVAAAGPAAEEMAPPQAPAIRPPVEVGEARFEFGLAETPPPAKPTYELPGLIDEWAASAVTRSMGTPEALTSVVENTALVPPMFTPSAFTGDAEVGYGFGESSRLGFSLQLLNLLTDAAESSANQKVAAQTPASPLPPAGAFFEPDSLLQAHWATHCPPVVALPSTVDLINNFLRRQPRLTRPAMLPPAASHQADLSVRSTRAEPDLVSENLARIFVRQGKTARAIEIYEKLIVKQPEKMAYFTAQIQQLQPLA